MQTITTPHDIQKLGTILGVWAHPDDETYSMAGIMAAAVKNGQTVACVTATRGEHGVQDESRWPQAQLADIRTKELTDAFAVLGVKNHHWLDYPDGGCIQVNEDEAVQRIVAYIQKYQPDSIFTFGPDGMTGHDDHKTVSRWAMLAKQQSGSEATLYCATNTEEQYVSMIEADAALNVFFNINKPPIHAPESCAVCFELTDELYEQKRTALQQMASQTEAMLSGFDHVLRKSIGTEAFIFGKDVYPDSK